jgi:peptidyl-prolyl cis-trans isomerase C
MKENDMMRTWGFLSTLLAGLLLVSGCDQMKGMFQGSLGAKTTAPASGQQAAPVVYGTVLAKINGETITLESFDEKVKDLQSLSSEIKINTPEEKKNYLNDLITQELIYQEAKSRGIEKQKDVKEAMEEFRKSVMARQLILDETKGIAVEPAEIEAFYNQYKQAFAAPRQVRARQIVVSTEQAAKDILIQLLQGGDFAALARERSADATASKGGDLGTVKAEEQFDKFNEVVATLDAGEVSPIFKGPKGYYIVKVDEVTGGAIPQMTDTLPETNTTVYDQIKNGLLQQKQAQRIQDLTDRLKAQAKIEIKDELLR